MSKIKYFEETIEKLISLGFDCSCCGKGSRLAAEVAVGLSYFVSGDIEAFVIADLDSPHTEPNAGFAPRFWGREHWAEWIRDYADLCEKKKYLRFANCDEGEITSIVIQYRSAVPGLRELCQYVWEPVARIDDPPLFSEETKVLDPYKTEHIDVLGRRLESGVTNRYYDHQSYDCPEDFDGVGKYTDVVDIVCRLTEFERTDFMKF